jgi:dTDP-4-dehydrorhamnose reductase
MSGRLLVTGAAGQLGRALCEAGEASGLAMVGLGRGELDLTDANALTHALDCHAPAVVINAAAFTDVEGATDSPEAAYAGNHQAPALLAEACAARDIGLVHVSTDYVFDGGTHGRRRPDEPTRPINVYGLSKLAGENAVRASGARAAIVRTGWLFAPWGRNFLTTMLRLGRERTHLQIVDDQWGGPTSALDLAAALLTVAHDLHPGTYHYGGQPETSWYRFAEAIFAQAAERGLLTAPTIVPVPSTSYPTKARRPACSLLDCRTFTETFGLQPPDWRVSLATVLARIDPPAS